MTFPTPSSSRVHRLLAGQLLQWRAPAGSRLACLRGRMLVSQEGVAEDFDLKAGDALAMTRAGRVLAEAIGDAEMAVLSPRRWWHDWLAVLERRLPRNIAVPPAPTSER